MRSSASLHVAHGPAGSLRFRVLTADGRSIATTTDAELAAATALAVARHDATRTATIAASDGHWLEINVDGHVEVTPPTSTEIDWLARACRTVERLSCNRNLRHNVDH